MTKIDSSLVGAAGEHLVLSRLLSKGILAAQAPRGVRKVDILVNFFDGSEPCLLQVKTRSVGSDGGWHMSAKHEDIRDIDLLYCFVDLQPSQPTVHIIPSLIVAEVLEKDNRIWMATPGKQGQPHNETKFRRLRPSCAGQEPDWMDKFLEKWELIHT
jgi:hypothetical protein